MYREKKRGVLFFISAPFILVYLQVHIDTSLFQWLEKECDIHRYPPIQVESKP